jgi:hypothetical protein
MITPKIAMKVEDGEPAEKYSCTLTRERGSGDGYTTHEQQHEPYIGDVKRTYN